MGEINKGVVALLLVLVFGAAGYLWYTMMYTPAVEDRTAAQGELASAEQTRAVANSELEAAQKAIEEAKSDAGKPDDSVARVQIARKAVPNARLIDDASIVLTDIARRSGVRTSFKATGGDDAASGASGGPQGATPIDLTFDAVGTYDRMMLFMRLVESTVSVEDGKLYARDRLFNVVKMELKSGDSTDSGSTGRFGMTSGSTDSMSSSNLVAKAGELGFTVTVRMYSSTKENAQNIGNATPDPAASGSADPAAAGGATSTPGSANSASVDPSTSGASTGQPSAGSAGAATAGGATGNSAGATAGATGTAGAASTSSGGVPSTGGN